MAETAGVLNIHLFIFVKCLELLGSRRRVIWGGREKLNEGLEVRRTRLIRETSRDVQNRSSTHTLTLSPRVPSSLI